MCILTFFCIWILLIFDKQHLTTTSSHNRSNKSNMSGQWKGTTQSCLCDCQRSECRSRKRIKSQIKFENDYNSDIWTVVEHLEHNIDSVICRLIFYKWCHTLISEALQLHSSVFKFVTWGCVQLKDWCFCVEVWSDWMPSQFFLPHIIHYELDHWRSVFAFGPQSSHGNREIKVNTLSFHLEVVSSSLHLVKMSLWSHRWLQR